MSLEEKTDLLNISMMIEGLTISRVIPQYGPLQKALPSQQVPYRRLASGPFDAYLPISTRELFRYTPPEVDSASNVILTGTPVVSDDSGVSIIQSRWNIETEGHTIVLKVGDRLNVGSFSGTVEDIYEDIVILRQSNGFRWVVMLGERLSNAVAVPL